MRRFLTALFLIFLLPLPHAAVAWPVEVEATPLALDGENAERRIVGRLRYRGGLELSVDNDAFGGFSALAVSADGSEITAISDTARWFRARPVYVNGNLVGLSKGRMGVMRDARGAKLRGRRADLESLTRAADGGLVLAFERAHRLWRYQKKHARDFKKPAELPPPPGLEHAPNNGGMEALTTLADGRYLVITEALQLGPGLVRAWIGDGENWDSLSYATSGGFQPTGADTLPNGDVLVLERRFVVPTGPGARISRIPADSIKPGARLSADRIATLEPPLILDNFEGIAIRRGDRGETLIYLISDDNFREIQRTLLVMFELMED